jgi:hypothetical protein
MRMVERKYGKARRVWVFDRGIIGEDNLKALRRRNGQYLVGTPRAKLKEFEKRLLGGDWNRIRPDVEVRQIPTPSGEETYLLCRSTSRKEKEVAMRARASSSIEKALGKLERRIASRQLKDRLKIERMLGKIQARHPSVQDLYQMAVLEKSDGPQLQWKLIEERRAWRDAREGAYLLRTNLKEESPEELYTPTGASGFFTACRNSLQSPSLLPKYCNRTGCSWMSQAAPTGCKIGLHNFAPIRICRSG